MKHESKVWFACLIFEVFHVRQLKYAIKKRPI